MYDFVTDNFSLLEAILFLELTLLLTAIVFFYAAKIAAKGSRHDPILRFWYVFWRAFAADVTPVRLYDSRFAEMKARELGLVGAGEMTPQQLNELDAPELGNVDPDEVVSHAIELPPLRPVSSGHRSKSDSPPPPAGDGTLDARIIGRSDRDAIAGRDGQTLVAAVRNEVEDGQANGVLVRLISNAINVPVYRIVLLRGHYKADKAFKIVGVSQFDLDARVRQLPPT